MVLVRPHLLVYHMRTRFPHDVQKNENTDVLVLARHSLTNGTPHKEGVLISIIPEKYDFEGRNPARSEQGTAHTAHQSASVADKQARIFPLDVHAFLDLDLFSKLHVGRYHGIFALASLFHIPRQFLPATIAGLVRHFLEESGFLLTTLPTSAENEQGRDGRWHTGLSRADQLTLLQTEVSAFLPAGWGLHVVEEVAGLPIYNGKWMLLLAQLRVGRGPTGPSVADRDQLGAARAAVPPGRAVSAYHDDSSHQRPGFYAQGGSMDWNSQPDKILLSESGDMIDLPLMANAGSCGNVSAEIDVAQFLQQSFGLTAVRQHRVHREHRWSLRANPTGGALQPLEVFVFSFATKTLQEAGEVLHYNAFWHSLQRRGRLVQAQGANAAASLWSRWECGDLSIV